MESKYHKGQKVTIRSVSNSQMRRKYPDIEGYVSKTGIVVESFWVGFEELPGVERLDMPRDFYCYFAEVNGEKVAVPEDALVA